MIDKGKYSMVIFENVSKEFKGKIVLKHVNVKIAQGEICGLIGKNGSGKSVFMKLAAGMSYPTEGKITVNGKILAKGEFPHNTGIVLDNIGFLKEKTGYKNLKILAGILNKISDEQIISTMESMGLNANDKTIVGKYSVGMKQKLLLAQAMMEEPDLLLLDEPFNGLDEDSERRIIELLRQTNARKGTTIVIVSHDKDELENLCHRIYKVHNKRLEDVSYKPGSPLCTVPHICSETFIE